MLLIYDVNSLGLLLLCVGGGRSLSLDAWIQSYGDDLPCLHPGESLLLLSCVNDPPESRGQQFTRLGYYLDLDVLCCAER